MTRAANATYGGAFVDDLLHISDVQD